MVLVVVLMVRAQNDALINIRGGMLHNSTFTSKHCYKLDCASQLVSYLMFQVIILCLELQMITTTSPHFCLMGSIVHGGVQV